MSRTTNRSGTSDAAHALNLRFCRIKRAKGIVLVAVMLTAAVVWGFVSHRPPAHREPPGKIVPAPTGAAEPAVDATSVRTIGRVPRKATLADAACKTCHAEIVEAYQRSGMARTWRPAATGMPEASHGEYHVDDNVTHFRYAVTCGVNGVEQVETHADYSDFRSSRRAAYAIGSGNKAIALVADQNGYLTQLPAAWFSDDQNWRMNPGFELQNHRFSRPITTGCVACHTTAATHEVPARNRFVRPVADGIDCSRCHGPAESHVTYWSATQLGHSQSGPHSEAWKGASVTDASANPQTLTATLSDSQRNDLCLQCHLQGDVTVYRPGSDPLSFEPGDRLRDHRHDFLIVGDNAPLGIASHGARMLQSRCYRESGGRLTCVVCHDPHRPAADLARGDYDARCAVCHTPQSCSRPQSQPVRDTMEGCVACHMPRRSSQEGIHLVLTDHALQAHASTGDVNAKSKTPLVPNTVRVELVSAWPGDPPSPAIQGAAYVLLHETFGPQPAALQRARDQLRTAGLAEPGDDEIRFWLGSAFVGLGEGDEAVDQLAPLVERQPDRHAARFRLAAAYELTGDFARATTHYRYLVDEAPHWMEPYPRLAQLYLAQQQARWAVAILEQQLSLRDDPLAQAQLALARRLSGGSHSRAMQHVEQALQLDPLLPRIYLHRAALSLINGDAPRARADFQHVLKLDPGNREAREALEAMAAGPY